MTRKFNQGNGMTPFSDASPVVISKDDDTKSLRFDLSAVTPGTKVVIEVTDNGIVITNGAPLQGFEIDPDTTNIASGIIGFTGGMFTSDDFGTESIDAFTWDVSGQPDGDYLVQLYGRGNINDYPTSFIGLSTGKKPLCRYTVTNGVITQLLDARTWAQTSEVLAGLAHGEYGPISIDFLSSAGNITFAPNGGNLQFGNLPNVDPVQLNAVWFDPITRVLKISAG